MVFVGCGVGGSDSCSGGVGMIGILLSYFQERLSRVVCFIYPY
jgi:glycerate kinase